MRAVCAEYIEVNSNVFKTWLCLSIFGRVFLFFSACVSKYSLVVNLKNCSGSLFCLVKKIISFVTEYSINVHALRNSK
jgi:hypothetical protein